MIVLVTGSAGHLGEALVRELRKVGHIAIGLDIKASPFTTAIGTIVDRSFVRAQLRDVQVVLHVATLHKPHLATHSRQDFVDVNVTGTVNLLEEAAAAGVETFVYTSTTSAFGRTLTPPPGRPAAWITEDVVAVPKNIYGATKIAAENLCEIVHHATGLPCVILRTSRFFPEPDDNPEIRQAYDDSNAKVNELLYRRVDLEDVVAAHLLAMEKAPTLRFGRYIISATTPFSMEDLPDLRRDATAVVRRRMPHYEAIYARWSWSMFPTIDRIYVNERARLDLAWEPRYDFARALELLAADDDYRSPLARTIGSKGYHAQAFTNGIYPV